MSRGTGVPVIEGGPQPIELVRHGDETFGEWVLELLNALERAV